MGEESNFVDGMRKEINLVVFVGRELAQLVAWGKRKLS